MQNNTSKKQSSNPVGANLLRNDVYEKVTGSAIYVNDIQFGDKLLYARAVRSPHPHAIIKKIDTSKAESLPGVKAVITGKDFPERTGPYPKDKTIFAVDRVRFVGEPIAAVAATSEEIAINAVNLIEVDYELLEAVFNAESSASGNAPLLHPQLCEYEKSDSFIPKPGTNIANHFKLRHGDCEEAWKRCEHIVEKTFSLPPIQHTPIETHGAIAKMDMNGKIILWSSTQSPFAQRNLIADALQISHSDVRVIVSTVGGGFGSKSLVFLESIPAALATKCRGWAVKFIATREEELFTITVRQGMVAHVKVGCDASGNILSLKNTMYWDVGAYACGGLNVSRASGISGSGPYDIPNVEIDSYCVYTNHPIGGAYRGYGMAEIHTALNLAIDELAEKAGIDPVCFLKRNAIAEGDVISNGMTMHANGIQQCIEKVANSIEFNKKEYPTSSDRLRGKGIAILWKAPTMPPNAGSSAIVHFAEDGHITLEIGEVEIGQGVFTVMAQIAAAALGVEYENVHIAAPIDTVYSPYDWTTGASRLTWSLGNAVRAAALDARKQILDIMAEFWNENPEDLDIVKGVILSYKSEQKLLLSKMVIHGLRKTNDQGWIGGPIIGRGSFMPNYVTGLDPKTGQGTRPVVHYTVGCEGIDIEVEKKTGRIHILKAAAAYDVGKAINPALVKAQIEGGFVQGLSSALFEEIQLRNGIMMNSSLMDYRIASIADVNFPFEAMYVEVPQDDGPWGARGVGEHSMVPTISDLGNAIYAATGIRLNSAPFTAEKIYLGMLDAGIIE